MSVEFEEINVPVRRTCGKYAWGSEFYYIQLGFV
jgi:hypothetical protein